MENTRLRCLAALTLAVVFPLISAGCGSNPELKPGTAQHTSALAQRTGSLAPQTLSQTSTSTAGAQFICSPLNYFGNWVEIYAGGGGENYSTLGKTGLTQCLHDTGFHFSIPETATVTSVSVTFTAYIQVLSGSKQSVDYCVAVTEGEGYDVSGLSCTDYQSNTSPKSFTVSGSVQSLYTPAVINSANFGIVYSGDLTQNSNYQEYFFITNPKVTVYYTN